ncbi:hypothetical protein J4439_01510 [Candidatus Woesearchaeota archaeon]|nr:hypothetical protein [Candidatus Woesearchaeota archaeon]
MAKAKRTVLEKKVKKKKWVQVLAPEVFSAAEVGELPLTATENAMGRVVTANLMNITHDIKQQNINIRLKVTKVDDDKAHTSIQSFRMMPTAVKRMTHRRMDVIEDSSVYLSGDQVALRIKPMLFTRGNTTNSVKRALRKGLRNLILRSVRQSKVEEVFRDALSNKLQYDIEKELGKIYPIKSCVIRELTQERQRQRKKSKAVDKEEEVHIRHVPKKEEEWDLPHAPEEKIPELEASEEIPPDSEN